MDDQEFLLRLASPAELREMVQTLTRELDEARAEVKRLRAAMAKAGRISRLTPDRDEEGME